MKLNLKRFFGKYLLPSYVAQDWSRTVPVSAHFGFDRGTPIDRYYVQKALEQNASDARGVILEIGESTYSKKIGYDVDRFEVLHFVESSNATIVGDLTQYEQLPEAFADCFICTQTLNFIFDVQSAIQGIHHVLKPGGVFLGTVAGISQISRYDMDRWGDYWRFTTASLESLFRPVFQDRFTIKAFGNVRAATAFLEGLCVEEIPNSILDIHDENYPIVLSIRAVR